MKEALFIAYQKINYDTQGQVKFDDLVVKVIAGGLVPHLTVNKLKNKENTIINFVFILMENILDPTALLF